MSMPRARQEKGWRKMRWPMSPAKNRLAPLEASAARKRSSATLRSWDSSMTAASKGAEPATASARRDQTALQVVRPRASRSARAAAMTDQRASRWVPPTRVLRPRRGTVA